MSKVAFVASAPHYLDHLAPVYWALPEDLRGPFLIGSDSLDMAKLVVARAERLKLPTTVWLKSSTVAAMLKESGAEAVVVSAWGDLQTSQASGLKVVFMEHGAGQSYGGDKGTGSSTPANHPSYAGSPKRSGVELFLCPGPHPRARNAAAHPSIPTEVIGCPKLDALHSELIAKGPKKRGKKPVVALAFHWECQVAPETRSAFPHMKSAIEHLAKDDRWHLIGHAHPRASDDVWQLYESLGVEIVRELSDVFDRADVLVADNTSAIYEFASLDRPVVLMNAPWYRREVNHGLRFWDAAHVGEQVDRPQDLSDAIAAALDDTVEKAAVRRHAVRMVYGYTDGQAAERAAKAITKLVAPRHAFSPLMTSLRERLMEIEPEPREAWADRVMAAVCEWMEEAA